VIINSVKEEPLQVASTPPIVAEQEVEVKIISEGIVILILPFGLAGKL